jgi:hypothetical protein
LWLNSELKKDIPNLKITLTNFYPNISAFEFTKKQLNNFEFTTKPIDVRNAPKDLVGLRTQFLSLHLFKPKDAKQILQNAIDSNSAIGIFEAQERSFTSILAILFSPISMLLTTPFIRPFKIGLIIFTYLIPIVLLFILWDGTISSLRAYSVKEINTLIEYLNNTKTYNWDIEKIKYGSRVVLYLLGTKKEI